MKDLIEKYKTYSNLELLKIVNQPDNYQPIAIEAANTVLASRQLTEQDYENAKIEIDILKAENEAQAQKKKERENQVKNVGASVISMINPIQTEKPSTEKIIKTVSFVLAVFFLFQLYNELGVIKYMLDSGSEWRFNTVISYFPIATLLIGTVLFFKRSTLGWILLAAYLIFSTIGSISSFIKIQHLQRSEIPMIDDFFPQTSPITSILFILFFAAILWTICKKEIRDVYAIDRQSLLEKLKKHL